MSTIDIMTWFDPCILNWMVLAFVLNGLIAFAWHKKFYSKLGLKTYQAIQRIHLNETPRLGGFIFLLSLVGFTSQCHFGEGANILRLILISLIPAVLVALKEDLFHDVEPAMRLLSIIFAGWLFRASYTGALPNMTEIPFVGELFLLQGGVSLFYILSMVAIANGMNLIDGVNGLCSAVALSILSALLFLSYKTGDTVMLSTLFSVILLVIPFMLLNFPFGKIFLGDLGAYCLGLILGMLTIILFGRHPEISPYLAVLILIYPLTEMVFTMVRRILRGVSVFRPDTLHLHLKLFYFLRPQPAYKKMANALVMPTLGILWIFPLLAVTWVYQKPLFAIFAIAFFLVFYVSLYLMFPNIQKKKKQFVNFN
jgi:UDP-N-acetylmuramyl pentapeptide phosphotransferase/UDP-N-acetylglucosamine-1-phosphate transferase